MYISNFRRLVNTINAEINSRRRGTTISKSLSNTRKRGPTLNSLCKSAEAIGRGLDKIKYPPPLSKSQRRIINRVNMRSLRESLRQACLNKSLTANEVCLLETKANHLSTFLTSKGLL